MPLARSFSSKLACHTRSKARSIESDDEGIQSIVQGVLPILSEQHKYV